MKRKTCSRISLLLLFAMLVTGCGSKANKNSESGKESESGTVTESQSGSESQKETQKESEKNSESEKDTSNSGGSQVDDTILYKNMFEDGEFQGFGPRGSNTVEISNAKNHGDGGVNSMYVTGRTANWHGATMPVGDFVQGGKSYSFSAWVYQESGKTEKISMKFQYDADGTTQYPGICDSVDVPSGKWVELAATVDAPDHSGDLQVYFESPSSETLSFYVDDVVIKGQKAAGTTSSGSAWKEEENYKAMASAGVLSTGNNARIKAVLAKAREGKDVTLAYIGGSITSGGVASPNKNCYAAVSADKFAKTYGKDGGSNVHFINAGMHGTPSDIGVVRYERDVLNRLPDGCKYPDILFIEFAVNDYGCETKGGAYEGLIREALESGSAVVLVFSVFQTMNVVMETDYRKYGEYYDIPMISMGNAIKKYAKVKGFDKWYYGDNLHPNNTGHGLMADCIMELFAKIDKEDAEKDNITDINSMKAKTTDAYQGIKLINANTKAGGAISSIDAGSFSENDKETPMFGYPYDKNGKDANWFPDGWLHTSGKDPLTIKLTCKTFMLVYKLNSQNAYGSADLYIDGVKKTTLSCYDSGGWNNGKVCLAITDTEAKEHTIELKMKDGDESKKFSLMAIGYK